MMRARQRGLTLVEVMVSLAVVGLATVLIFGVQTRMSSALRDQQNIAEAQQTLRSAAALITKDVRMAGYMATQVFEQGDGVTAVHPVQITNGASGAPDTIAIISAANTCNAHVCDTNGRWCPHHGPAFQAAETEVDDNSCFKNGQLAYAVRTISVGTPGTTGYVAAGTGCILEITHDPQSAASGQNNKVQHHPAAPWNQSGNAQCDPLDPNGTTWNDGYTMFMEIKLRQYRIKPNDARGVLQVCDTGTCAAADWQDIALGIIDMQFALRIYEPTCTSPPDTVSFTAQDRDQDGDPNRNWISGDDMSNALALDTCTLNKPQFLMLSLTLVAKTTKEVNGPQLSEVPTLMDVNFPSAASPNNDPSHNRLSDKGAVSLPVTSTTTWPDMMYVGNVGFRVFTTTVDLRNLGVGVNGHT